MIPPRPARPSYPLPAAAENLPFIEVEEPPPAPPVAAAPPPRASGHYAGAGPCTDAGTRTCARTCPRFVDGPGRVSDPGAATLLPATGVRIRACAVEPSGHASAHARGSAGARGRPLVRGRAHVSVAGRESSGPWWTSGARRRRCARSRGGGLPLHDVEPVEPGRRRVGSCPGTAEGRPKPSEEEDLPAEDKDIPVPQPSAITSAPARSGPPSQAWSSSSGATAPLLPTGPARSPTPAVANPAIGSAPEIAPPPVTVELEVPKLPAADSLAPAKAQRDTAAIKRILKAVGGQ